MSKENKERYLHNGIQQWNSYIRMLTTLPTLTSATSDRRLVFFLKPISYMHKKQASAQVFENIE